MAQETINFDMFDDQNDGETLPMASDISIHVTENNSIYVTSREIAEQFKQKHKNILAAIKRIVDKDKSNLANTMFYKTTYTDSRNRQQPEYYVNQAGFNVLASGNLYDVNKRLEFGVAFQRKNEEIRAKLNKAIKELADLKKPTKEVIIAQGLIAANEVIEEQKKIIEQQQQTIGQKDQQLTAAKDDIDFANAFKGSTNNMLIRTLASKISGELNSEGYTGNGVGQNTMFEWLRKNGFLVASRKARDFNMPTKKAIDMGVLDSKYTPIEHKTVPGTWNSGTPVITPKGVEYFRRKIKNIYYEGGTINDNPHN